MKGKKMATMTLPIRELESCVRDKALPKAASVAEYSKSKGDGFATVCKIAVLTIGLKLVFGFMVRRQGKIISRLVEHDFNSCSGAFIGEMAKAIDELVKEERSLLGHASEVGYELRAFWPLGTLEAQVEHLDSIAESLYLASDPECVSLLSLAAEQMAG
jgi:hypothetical protein